MIYLIVYVLVVCALLALVYWAVPALGTPEPVARVVRVGAIIVAFVLILILLLNAFGMSTGGLQAPKL